MAKTALTIISVLVLSGLFAEGCKKKNSAQKPQSPQNSNQQTNGGDAARKAPDFTLQNYDGKTISLADCKGKIVVLEWFNYECPFSRYHHEEADTMVKLADKYKDKNTVWLAINSTKHQTAENNKTYAVNHGITYPVLDDRASTVGHAYGARTTPHMFIVDSKGEIIYDGAIDNSPMGKVEENYVNYVDEALAALIAGKDVTIKSTKPYGCSVKYTD